MSNMSEFKDENPENKKSAFEADPELDGLSFTQALRKKGFVNEMPASTENTTASEPKKEPAPTPKEEPKPTTQKVVKTAPKINTDVNTTGMSFTQSLRAQGYLGEDTETETEEQIEAPTPTPKEEPKPTTQKVVKTAPKINTDVDTTGMSFTQSLRAQGYLGENEEIETEEQIEVSSTTIELDNEKLIEKVEEVKEDAINIIKGVSEKIEKKVEKKVEKVVEKVEKVEKAKGEAKTFIDLIRSEGLL